MAKRRRDGSPSGLGPNPFPVGDLLRRKVILTINELGIKTAKREFYLTTPKTVL
jgi:hypothetical protein